MRYLTLKTKMSKLRPLASTMEIELRVFATYRKPVSDLLGENTEDGVVIELSPGTTLGDLIEQVGLKNEKTIITLVNGLRAEPSLQLSNGDRVGLFPPIGGG